MNLLKILTYRLNRIRFRNPPAVTRQIPRALSPEARRTLELADSDPNFLYSSPPVPSTSSSSSFSGVPAEIQSIKTQNATAASALPEIELDSSHSAEFDGTCHEFDGPDDADSDADDGDDSGPRAV